MKSLSKISFHIHFKVHRDLFPKEKQLKEFKCLIITDSTLQLHEIFLFRVFLNAHLTSVVYLMGMISFLFFQYKTALNINSCHVISNMSQLLPPI